MKTEAGGVAITALSTKDYSAGFVSENPTFNPIRASIARTYAENAIKICLLKEQVKLPEDTSLDALKIAIALGVYNIMNLDDPSLMERDLPKKLKLLFLKEIKSITEPNPLPAIGIEVESPSYPYSKDISGNFKLYSEFFDTIGMPRNKVNIDPEDPEDYWEFSPFPSHTVDVQSRILAELIKGGFIQSLKSSEKPEDIATFLDLKLISLHLNFGIPIGVEEEKLNSPETLLFASSVAIAYDSPLRLSNRFSTEFYRIKDSGVKSIGETNKKRLEFMALEVWKKSTYRLMKEMQLLTASFFAYCKAGDQKLAEEWGKLRAELREIYRRENIGPNLGDKESLAELVENSDVSRDIRRLLDASSRRISSCLSGSR